MNGYHLSLLLGLLQPSKYCTRKFEFVVESDQCPYFVHYPTIVNIRQCNCILRGFVLGNTKTVEGLGT